jgi:oxalate---CoA ligase
MKLSKSQLGSISRFGEEKVQGAKIFKEMTIRAKILKDSGVGRGDKVIISHGNSPEFFIDLFAVWEVGACAACLNPNATDFELKKIVEFVRPLAILTNENRALEGFSGIKIFNLEQESKQKSETIEPNKTTNDVALDDNALILFTSGTTGVPKGVVHSFRSLLARVSLNQYEIGKDTLKNTLCPLPTHFGHGLIGNCLTALLAGGDLILYPVPDIRAIVNLGKVIDDFEITFISSVPTMWKILVKASPAAPVKNTLKRIHIGSAPLSADLWNKVIEWSGIKNVANTFGITETANWISGASAEEFTPQDGLIGRVWGGSAMVLNEEGKIVDEGRGEILIQSPSLMNGYLDLPDLTEKVLRGGYFYTGDVGEINDGILYLTGRKKFEINKGGLKVNPEDIDILLEANHAIREACAFGVEDEVAGEIVGVAIVANEDTNFEFEPLKKWIKERLSKEKVPSKWFLLDEIPKTDRGKVNRFNVAELCKTKPPLKG